MAISIFIAIAILLSSSLALQDARSQGPATPPPPVTRGGEFVTPVAGLPFTAVIDQRTHQAKTTDIIARDSKGRVYAEIHEFVSSYSNRQPKLLSIHIYDPNTRLNTLIDLRTHTARQNTLPNSPATAPPYDWAQQSRYASAGRNVANAPASPNVKLKNLGIENLNGVQVQGYRRDVDLSPLVANVSPRRRGRPTDFDQSAALDVIGFTDEYWYSDELHINMLAKHDDWSDGERTITVTKLNRAEPSADLFEIPAGCKLLSGRPTDEIPHE